MNVTIHCVKVTALVDTGASCNLLRRDVWEKIIEITHRTSYLQPTGPIQGISGTPISALGKSNVIIEGVRNPIDVVIADKLPHEMIIGDAALRKGHGIIDVKNNKLQWYGRQWNMKCHHQLGCDGLGPLVPLTGNEDINRVMLRNTDVFFTKYEPQAQCHMTAMTIETNGRPISQKAYRAPLNKRRLVEEAVEEMLNDGPVHVYLFLRNVGQLASVSIIEN